MIRQEPNSKYFSEFDALFLQVPITKNVRNDPLFLSFYYPHYQERQITMNVKGKKLPELRLAFNLLLDKLPN